MVITEVGTGEIKAMVGTRKVTGQMLFNRATNPRQPGSSIKPLAVYAPALQRSLEYQDEGKIFKFTDKVNGKRYDKQGTDGWGDFLTVSSTVIDEPMQIEGRTWPKNVTRTYSGRNTFRTAIQKSINTCAVKMLIQIGVDYSMDTLQRFGITSVVTDTSQSVNDLNLAALGLGAMTYGISPLEMSAAYATFPNGGVRNTTICYTKVEDSGGRTLLEAKSETVRVLDKGVAWIMTNTLQTVVNANRYLYVEGVQCGGKTGTTSLANSCLILMTENEDGERFFSVVLGSKTKDTLYHSMSELLEKTLK
jgi:penicillin-binding protein 1A